MPSLEQFKLLHERFPTLATATKGLLLSAYLKMLLSDPSNTALQAEVTAVYQRYSRQLDPELQQRSAEYLVRWQQGWCRGSHCMGAAPRPSLWFEPCWSSCSVQQLLGLSSGVLSLGQTV